MTQTVYLRRDHYADDGTFGVLVMNGETLACTCELPWRDNEPDNSCIPEGTYGVQPHNSADHPGTWEVIGVPDRAGILIHDGNTEADTKGCILVGDSFGQVAGKDAVMNSKKTLEALRSELPPYFKLIIEDGVAQ